MTRWVCRHRGNLSHRDRAIDAHGGAAQPNRYKTRHPTQTSTTPTANKTQPANSSLTQSSSNRSRTPSSSYPQRQRTRGPTRSRRRNGKRTAAPTQTKPRTPPTAAPVERPLHAQSTPMYGVYTIRTLASRSLLVSRSWAVSFCLRPTPSFCLCSRRMRASSSRCRFETASALLLARSSRFTSAWSLSTDGGRPGGRRWAAIYVKTASQGFARLFCGRVVFERRLEM